MAAVGVGSADIKAEVTGLAQEANLQDTEKFGLHITVSAYSCYGRSPREENCYGKIMGKE